MSDAAAPAATPPSAATHTAAAPSTPPIAAAPPQPAAQERRVHVYEAVANQRSNVLSSFDAQRAAIFKAVADQRQAALAPILAVQAKMTTPGAAAPVRSTASGGQVTPQQLIVADIVMALKALVAEEVRLQLGARLGASQPTDAAPPTDGASPASDASGSPVSARSGPSSGPPAVNADFVATLKLMVADEVAAQLDALLRAAAVSPAAGGAGAGR